MTERLVCAVDGTPRSAGAIRAASEIARVLGMRLVLVHVVKPEGESSDAARARAATDLERSLARLAVPADAVRRVEVGDAAELVVAAADDERATLILTGTRAAGPRAKAVFGSVTSRIVELADVPVVIAPEACCDSAMAGSLPVTHEVIIGVDGSDDSPAVAALAGRLARRARAGIVLAHVIPATPPTAAPPVGVVPPLSDLATGAGRRALEKARQAIPGPADVELELVHGIPSCELEELAKARGSDLIVLGTRRPGRLRRLLAGSIADELAVSGSRLVMVIPDDVARREASAALELATVS